MRLSIFAAFPQEFRCILKNFKPKKSLKINSFSLFFTKYSSKEIVLIQTGIGTRNAEAALKYVLEEHRPDIVLSIGFGGALYDGASAGDLIYANRVVFIPESFKEEKNVSNLGDLSSKEVPNVREIVSKLSEKVSMHEGCILTLERYIKKSEIIKYLSKDLSFPVCDMETFFLAKLSIEQGIPFLAVRSVTDRFDEEIPPEFLSVTDESGRYKLSRALGLILKPRLIKDIIRTGRASAKASKNLYHLVKAVIEII